MDRQEANLLLITFDQWRGDWTDPLKPIVRMPCFQKLGQNGLIARRCYTNSPQCVPARISWLTGLMPSQLGVTRNCNANVPNDAPSIFRRLQKQGWHTELIGKTHWTSHMQPGDLRENLSLLKDLGFSYAQEIAGPRALQIMQCDLTDEWKDEGVFNHYLENMKKRYQRGRTEDAWNVSPSILPDHLYPDIWIANRGVKAIQRMPSDQPWLLWISFVGPHEPFDTPKRWTKKSVDKLPEFVKRGTWIDCLPDNSELRKTAKSWDGLLTEKKINELRRDYACNLRLLDDQLELLSNALANRKDISQTAIAITADHGEMLGDHEMLYKTTFLESSITVPFQYIPPKHTAGKQVLIDKPIGLTKSITAVISNLKSGGSIDSLQKCCRNQKYVTIEYGKEIVIIKNKRKLCCDKYGNPLWATNLGKDPYENKNLILDNQNLLLNNKKWQNLVKIARTEIDLRQKENWIWRKIV